MHKEHFYFQHWLKFNERIQVQMNFTLITDDIIWLQYKTVEFTCTTFDDYSDQTK